MEVETSTKSFAKRPKIKPGFYAAQLKSIKTVDNNGKFFEKVTRWGSVANYAILEFQIYKVDDQDRVTDAVTFTEKNIASDVFLSQFVNWRDTKVVPGGESLVKSGFTPESAATRTFKALGWSGPEEGKKLNMDTYLGAWTTAIVDDYTKTENGETVTFSVIKEVKPFKGAIPVDKVPSSVKESAAKPPLDPAVMDAFLEKVAVAKTQLTNNMLTQHGFDTMVVALRKEYGID